MGAIIKNVELYTEGNEEYHVCRAELIFVKSEDQNQPFKKGMFVKSIFSEEMSYVTFAESSKFVHCSISDLGRQDSLGVAFMYDRPIIYEPIFISEIENVNVEDDNKSIYNIGSKTFGYSTPTNSNRRVIALSNEISSEIKEAITTGGLRADGGEVYVECKEYFDDDNKSLGYRVRLTHSSIKLFPFYKSKSWEDIRKEFDKTGLWPKEFYTWVTLLKYFYESGATDKLEYINGISSQENRFQQRFDDLFKQKEKGK